jgi:FdhD protein
VQKALMAAVPILVAVEAPSSLADEMVKRFGMTLIGFARERKFNIYSGEWRLRCPPQQDRRLDLESPD